MRYCFKNRNSALSDKLAKNSKFEFFLKSHHTTRKAKVRLFEKNNNFQENETFSDTREEKKNIEVYKMENLIPIISKVRVFFFFSDVSTTIFFHYPVTRCVSCNR